MSQLITRLKREVQSATDPEDRAALLARISGILARMRNFDEAKRIVDDLRRIYGDGRSGRVTVWIMLAEALILLFEKLSPQALDRISRAQALGMAMKYSTIVALASAWKAHLEFEEGTYNAMIQSLATAIEYTEETNHDANTRLAIVLCNALTICGEKAESQKWFMRAREQAAINGDQPSVASLLHNRAVFQITRARADNCIEAISPDELRPIRMELESMRNFDDLTKLVAFPSHILLWDARLQMLEGDFAAALGKLSSIRDKSPFADHNFSLNYIGLETCFCKLHMGQLEESVAEHRALGQIQVTQLDVDEQLVAAWMLWRMSLIDARFGDSIQYETHLGLVRAAYKLTMAKLGSSLKQFSLPA